MGLQDREWFREESKKNKVKANQRVARHEVRQRSAPELSAKMVWMCIGGIAATAVLAILVS